MSEFDDQRIRRLEARILELEAQVRRLEAQLAGAA